MKIQHSTTIQKECADEIQQATTIQKESADEKYNIPQLFRRSVLMGNTTFHNYSEGEC